MSLKSKVNSLIRFERLSHAPEEPPGHYCITLLHHTRRDLRVSAINGSIMPEWICNNFLHMFQNQQITVVLKEPNVLSHFRLLLDAARNPHLLGVKFT